jgi:hypothetical protein
MPSFCTNCGAPAGGHFCTKCGAAIGQASPQTHPPASTPRSSTGVTGASSGFKILLIVVGILMLFGAIGVGGLVYVGYRAKQKIAQIKQDYEVNTATTAASRPRVFPAARGSGCRLLEGKEAAEILGVAVDRAEFAPNGPEGGTEWCRYWVNASERARLNREEVAAGFKGLGKGDGQPNVSSIEKIIGGAAGVMIDGNGENKDSDYAFSLQVWHQNGKHQWEKMQTAQAGTKNAMGADVAAVAMQSVTGVGDQAIVLPAGHSIMVLKGDTFFLLGFQQFVPGQEKTIALARVVAGRI